MTPQWARGQLTIEQSLPGNLSMEDWQVMREIVEAVRQALPDAADRRPGAVLEHVPHRPSSNQFQA